MLELGLGEGGLSLNHLILGRRVACVRSHNVLGLHYTWLGNEKWVLLAWEGSLRDRIGCLRSKS